MEGKWMGQPLERCAEKRGAPIISRSTHTMIGIKNVANKRPF